MNFQETLRSLLATHVMLAEGSVTPRWAHDRALRTLEKGGWETERFLSEARARLGFGDQFGAVSELLEGVAAEGGKMLINLSAPTRTEIRPLERVGENRAQRTVFVYTCPAGHVVRVRASSFQGMDRGGKPLHAVPSTGAIRCPQCP